MTLNKKKLDKIKKGFDENGYILLNKFFDKNKIALIKKNLFNFLNKKKETLKKKEKFTLRTHRN